MRTLLGGRDFKLDYQITFWSGFLTPSTGSFSFGTGLTRPQTSKEMVVQEMSVIGHV